MRMFSGVTSMLFAAAIISAGCSAARTTATETAEKAEPVQHGGAPDAVIHINGLSCPL